MLCEYSYTNYVSLVQIGATLAEIQNFFYGIIFIGATCMLQHVRYTARLLMRTTSMFNPC